MFSRLLSLLLPRLLSLLLPQALIYPLTVATKSTSSVRNAAANRILNSMSDHSSKLVQQARMVSEELIRVAILWHEQWHVALEEACRLYFAENNVEGMLNVLKPLHLMMEKGPQTLKEISFDHVRKNNRSRWSFSSTFVICSPPLQGVWA